jgi:copper chaperone CopZ
MGKLKQKKVAIAAYTNLQAFIDKVNNENPSTSTLSLSSSNDFHEAEPEHEDGHEHVSYQSSSSSPSSDENATHCGGGSSGTGAVQERSTAGNTSVFHTFLSSRLGGSGSRVNINSAHTHTLFISGLKDDKTKKLISECLVNVKGVISFVIDLTEQKVIVRSIISIDNIIQAIFSSTGMRASLKETPKSQHHQHHLTETHQDDNKENYPDYLPESKHSSNSNNSNRGWFGLGAIISFSDAKKKEQQKQRDASSSESWFSKLGKALNII